MSIFGNLFGRQYETVASIKYLTLTQILNILPDQISTTKIIRDNEFKTLPPVFQKAVKYIKTRKDVLKQNNVPYENIENDFKKYKLQDNREVSQLIDETSVGIDLNKQQEEFELAQLERRLIDLRKKEGGKKRSRKQRKQRRRKTRRSV